MEQSQLLKIKKSIKVLDLGSLCHLKRLSLRGCSTLHTLRMPPSLVALDASACTKLKEVTVVYHDHFENDNSSSGDGLLQALNLNGCRSLSKGMFSNASILKNITALDLTCAKAIPTKSLAHALYHSKSLTKISLRYIANDEILEAISASSATAEGLCLVDVAFSHVTDMSVEKLVRNALHLER